MENLIDEYTSNEWEQIHKEFNRIKGKNLILKNCFYKNFNFIFPIFFSYKDNHYLDHAGTTLYSEQQIHNIYDTLSTNIYSNPHTSKSTEDLIDQVRYKILKHFNTTSNEYSIIFTSGATASLKIVAETFNFQSDMGQFVYLKDVHTSVLGMRELVQTKLINFVEKCDLLQEMTTQNMSTNNFVGNCSTESNSLFVYPAQCNFNGFKYPLELIDHIQTNGIHRNSTSNWFVCIDASSYVSTNNLDLTKYHPDFVCLSFYKMFGYPTGLGALLVSNRGQNVLKKRYYGGGTVKIAMAGKNWHEKRDCFHERYTLHTI